MNIPLCRRLLALRPLYQHTKKVPFHLPRQNTTDTYLSRGFLLILEPYETDNATVPNPIFHFTLVFCSLVEQLLMSSIMQVFRSIASYQARL